MPLGRSYYNVNGRTIGQHNVNGRVDFLTDALGNVTATVDQNAAIQNTYRYKAYGEVQAQTGVGPDPLLRWRGAVGARWILPRRYADFYFKAGHVGLNQGAWIAPPGWSKTPGTGPTFGGGVLGQRQREYCDGCDNTSPRCTLPGAEEVCDALGEDVAKKIALLLLERNTRACQCEVAFAGEATVHITKACFESTGFMNPMEPHCWVRNAHYTCKDLSGTASKDCAKVADNCKPPCGNPKTFNKKAERVTLPPLLKGGKLTVSVKLSGVEGTALLTGKVTVKHCTKAPKACPEEIEEL